MGRELLIRAAVRGDPAEAQQRFLGDPGAWLPAPARWYGRQTWRVTLHAGPLTRPVACRVGSVWSINGQRWRSLVWTPVPERDDLLPVAHGLPTLRGELGLLMVGGCPTLVVHAVYRPPVGSLGALADLLGLQRVARCTTTGFLETVADRLTARPRVPA